MIIPQIRIVVTLGEGREKVRIREEGFGVI